MAYEHRIGHATQPKNLDQMKTKQKPIAPFPQKAMKDNKEIVKAVSKHSLEEKSAFEEYVKAGFLTLTKWRPGKVKVTKPVAQVIDMFCGCGGMSLGFAAMAKANGAFRLIGGIDINEVSLKTYEHNYGVPAQKVDVRTLA